MRTDEAEARRLLEKYRILEPPVPVEHIARGEGAQIARHHFEGWESGFVLRDNGCTIIGVNTRTSPRRQRFTIAHEIGHLLLHEGKPLIVDHSVRVDWRDEVSAMATDSQEIMANAFAAALLMPAELIFSHLKQYVANIAQTDRLLSRDDLITQLARTFDVSTEAMGYRLINLGILAT
jgi:Zn-dependent peptidase ImmA (M78 family)